MSHISQIETFIPDDDFELFVEQCEAHGVAVNRNQKRFKYYGGAKGKCDHAIVDVVPVGSSNGARYEMGLRRARVTEEGQIVEDANGNGYVLVADHHGSGGGLYEKIGFAGSTVVRAFNEKRIERYAKRKRLKLTRTEKGLQLQATAKRW